jgi:hypothetical protein
MCARNIRRETVTVAEHSHDKWIEIYEKALTELEHARMRGRIGDSRSEIMARVEELKALPGLHEREGRAIEDALHALKFLEREEDQYDENQRRQAIETAARKLRPIRAKINKFDDSSPSRCKTPQHPLIPESAALARTGLRRSVTKSLLHAFPLSTWSCSARSQRFPVSVTLVSGTSGAG